MTRRVLTFAFLAFGTASLAGAYEIEPIFNLEFLGGQYFLAGRQASFSGNVAGLAAPAVIVNDRWTVLPSLASRYQGTKQIVELVGGGTLFSQRMNHQLGIKAIYRPPDSKWRFKPSFDYGLEFLKETRDETWTRGLFDYRVLDLGFEAEYVYFEPFSVRAAFDIVILEFPNYSALESKIAFDFEGQPLARELVGDRVLDTRTEMLTLQASRPLLGRGALEGRLIFQRQSFGNQRIVGSDGQFSSDIRRDLITHLEGTVRWPFEIRHEVRLAASWTMGLANRISNQNNFDARRTVFQAGYYNNLRLFAGPDIGLSLGDERAPIRLRTTVRFSTRRYPHRRIQDLSGAYQGDSLRQDDWALSTTLTYPMAPRFSLLLNIQAGRTTSNQGFEQFYNYSYGATNYLMGLRFEY